MGRRTNKILLFSIMIRSKQHSFSGFIANSLFIFFLNYSYGYKGQECVLKAVCEANAVSFRRDYSVFDELMHIFFRCNNDITPQKKFKNFNSVSFLYVIVLQDLAI